MFLKLALLTVVASCITSCTTQHLRCADVDIRFPWKRYDEWWRACKKEPSYSCKIVCIFKKAGFLNAKNELDIELVQNFVMVYPKELRETMRNQAKQCFSFSTFPAKFDTTCSEFMPFFNCMRKGVNEHCTVLKAGLFSPNQ